MPGAETTQLSVVIPVFNERDNVAVLAAEIRAAVDPLAIPYEVLFVDDGSTDGSAEALQAIAASDPRVRIVAQARNSGQSAALAAGFRHARGEIIVTLDADL